MTPGGYRFDRFVLDPADRQLRRDDVPVELNARYLDALALLIQEAGKLVSKDRFLDEVWRGVPVTDEALTQCIKTLRRQLGDDATRPRFIETVPKHGYRFIASINPLDKGRSATERPQMGRWRAFFLLGGAGTLGAGVAGAIGGLLYGFAGASQPLEPGIGGASVLLVLLWLTLAAALMGGAGVSFGIAAGNFTERPWGSIVGGALGGVFVGGVIKLLGLDAFNLLLGRIPRRHHRRSRRRSARRCGWVRDLASHSRRAHSFTSQEHRTGQPGERFQRPHHSHARRAPDGRQPRLACPQFPRLPPPSRRGRQLVRRVRFRPNQSDNHWRSGRSIVRRLHCRCDAAGSPLHGRNSLATFPLAPCGWRTIF